MKLCCGITLYNPNDSEIRNIYKYMDTFEYIYVYDNTEKSNLKMKFKEDKFVYISSGSNDGLSIAYNNICTRAIQDGHKYIMLLDQDSIVEPIYINKMINAICRNSLENIAVYGMDIIYNHKNKCEKNENSGSLRYVEWTISSGSIIDLSLFYKIGMFDENYFIDRVDFDYCISARKLGYKIAIVDGCYLKQKLGEVKKILGKKFSTHSPIRHYYSFRNRLYYYLIKNKFSIKNLVITIITSFRAILYIVFIEDKKKEKLKMILKAINDFKNNNMGSYNVN